MAKVTAQQYADKWGRRLKGSTEDIRNGVNNVKTAPGVLAAKQKELLKAKLIEAIDNGTWATAVAGVSLAEWQEKILNKGIPRISAGVDGAMGKQAVMAEQLLKNVDAAVAVVNQTPRGDLETNINRMTTFAREMNKRKVK